MNNGYFKHNLKIEQNEMRWYAHPRGVVSVAGELGNTL